MRFTFLNIDGEGEQRRELCGLTASRADRLTLHALRWTLAWSQSRLCLSPRIRNSERLGD